jgi:hypothetical protein
MLEEDPIGCKDLADVGVVETTERSVSRENTSCHIQVVTVESL